MARIMKVDKCEYCPVREENNVINGPECDCNGDGMGPEIPQKIVDGVSRDARPFPKFCPLEKFKRK